MSRTSFLGIPLDLLDMPTTVARCRELVAGGAPAQHVVVNAAKMVLIHDSPALREVVARCDLVNADGQSVVWAARLLGIPVPERVAGIDLMEQLLFEAEREGWPVYFLGARQVVLGAFLDVVRRKHPTLRIAGARDGYFTDDASAAEHVRSSGARLLFVAITSPRKEFFLADQLPRMGPVFAMGVGGSFDVWAGLTQRAPLWMQRIGLEWLFRLALEPRRLWRRYLVGNLRFSGLVAAELLRVGRRRRRSNVS